ncbi:MAG: succinate dehydrogenase/fumarate reductase iron-sulfur subunit [Snowella sp.]|nr:succinate dehydrogenase/fumarate reductase iron-sulfur subunit [Snowella sp.]
MQVKFNVFRQQPRTEPTFQQYALEVELNTTILDCLNRIKWEQDGSLAFRKNCRNAICGSCAVRINERPFLACKESIGTIFAWLKESNQENNHELTIKPLGNMPVIKDLVVDMANFWQDLESVTPYVLTENAQKSEREQLQSPAERKLLNKTANCILCGACYSDCDAKGKNAEFVGPHALAKAYRLIQDSRDSATDTRLQQHSEGKTGVWGCNGCRMCNISCPMGVDPMTQIEEMKVRIFDLLDPL